MNCDPKALAQAAKCFCFPKDITRAVKISLLCQWANRACGTPSSTIEITGAGVAAANQIYHYDGTKYIGFTDNSYTITLFAGIWYVTHLPVTRLYSADTFPCTWVTEPSGTDPAPVGRWILDIPFASGATNVGATSFDANWHAVTGVTGYRLDVATDVAFTSYVAGYQDLDVGNVTTYPVTGLTPNTPYYYRVRQYTGAETGGNSNVITTTTVLTPAAFAGLVAWWKADALVLNDGDPVAAWNDSSSGGHNLSQATPARRPTYKTNIVGTMPIVRFNAAQSNWMSWAVDLSLQDFTIIVVYFNFISDSILLGHTALNEQIRDKGGNLSKYFNNPPDENSSAIISATPGCAVWRRAAADAPATGKFRRNKVPLSTFAENSLAILNEFGGVSFGQFANCDIAEVVIYNNKLSDADVDSLYDNYFKPRWTALP